MSAPSRVTAFDVAFVLCSLVGDAPLLHAEPSSQELTAFDRHLAAVWRMIESLQDRTARGTPEERLRRDLADLRRQLLDFRIDADRDSVGGTTAWRVERLLHHVEDALSRDVHEFRVPLQRPEASPTVKGVVTGAIVGTVTREEDGTALANADVFLLDEGGYLAADGKSGADGTFSLSGVPAGSYYLLTAAPGYLRELYDDVKCADLLDCFPAAQAITVLAGEQREVEVSLGLGAKISGSLTEAAGGLPAQGVDILFTDDEGWYSGTIFQVDGAFERTGFAAGTYHARARGALYAQQLYDGIDCPEPCDATTGTPIVLPSDGEATAVDFALIRRGQVAGKVTDASTGLPIRWASVHAFTASGSPLTAASTDENGDYLLTGLDDGEVYVAAGYLNDNIAELYADVSCESFSPYDCDFARGQPLTVSVGTTIGDVDLVLDRPGEIHGQVVDELTGAPIADAEVAFFIDLWLAGSVSTGDDGTFASGPLPSDDYLIAARADGHLREIWNGVPCPGEIIYIDHCRTVEALPVAVRGGSLAELSFALERPSSISGRVIEARSGEPLHSIRIDLVSESHEVFPTAWAPPTGGTASTAWRRGRTGRGLARRPSTVPRSTLRSRVRPGPATRRSGGPSRSRRLVRRSRESTSRWTSWRCSPTASNPAT